jgi:hypothetical protein
MAENGFQIWDDVIHTMPDQMKRIASAKKTATSPNSIDKENKTGVFEGSGKEPYHVTLESCTCGDFKRRKLPCKHMYRLAMELGEFGGDFTEGTNKNVVSHGQIKFEEAVDEIEKLPEAAQRDLQHVFFWNPSPEYVYTREVDNVSKALESCPIIEVKEAPLIERIKLMKKVDIIHALNEMSVEYPKLLKEELIQWCAKNVPAMDDYAPKRCTVTQAFCVSKLYRQIYTYLSRKFDWNNSYDIFRDKEGIFVIPYGAQQVKRPDGQYVYDFPNDEVTDMLNKYHCNRCAGGYVTKARE